MHKTNYVLRKTDKRKCGGDRGKKWQRGRKKTALYGKGKRVKGRNYMRYYDGENCHTVTEKSSNYRRIRIQLHTRYLLKH